MKNWQKHILYWLAYGLYFYAINILGNKNLTFFTVLITLPYFALVYYSISYILNRFFLPPKRWMGLLYLCAFYICSSLIIYFVLYGWSAFSLVYGAYVVANYKLTWQEFVQTLLILHGHFSILALITFHYKGKLLASGQKIEEMELRRQAEDERKEFEYSAFAAQVPPHTLANIFLIWERTLKSMTPAIADQIGKLYVMMQFYMKAHDLHGPKTILLDDEVRAVNNFIAIHKDISPENKFIDVSAAGNLMKFSVPPTSLLTLIENSIKHGDCSQQNDPVKVNIVVEHMRYTMSVRNRKRPKGYQSISHNTGLRNLRNRLEMIYGSEHRLIINESDSHYEIQLTVEL